MNRQKSNYSPIVLGVIVWIGHSRTATSNYGDNDFDKINRTRVSDVHEFGLHAG